ncbi:MAG TPA: nucleotidyltransferase domain-containing protein [Candidatus Nanoarchaeia archaeon]|nr:nucleotidyltransferase domain-containing protein [Candidatus Nanoarchaeia archaeon]
MEHSSYDLILRVLFDFPEKEFSLTELARSSRLPKSTASRMLERLRKEKLVVVKEKGRIFLIRANSEDESFIRKKMLNNLSRVFDSSIVEKLNKSFHVPKAIVLFGSYRHGVDVSSSDVDIAIETSISGEFAEINEFRKFFGKSIQIHKFSRKKIDLKVFNNIANGIVLSGYLEVNK